MYIAHPTHGAGARPNRTQLKTAARKTTLNAGQCVHQPREGRGRNRQAPPPPPKKRRGVGEKARKQPTAAKPPANTTRGSQTPPPQKAPRTGPPKRHRGTTHPKSATPSQERRPTGKRDTETSKKKNREPPAHPGRIGIGGTGTTRPGTGEKKKTRAQKTHPDQPSQEGLGTAEARAQHTHPHHTPEPERAGGKRGAHETTHVPKAGQNRSPTTNTTNSRY